MAVPRKPAPDRATLIPVCSVKIRMRSSRMRSTNRSKAFWLTFAL